MSDKMKTMLAILIALFFAILPFGIILELISLKIVGIMFIILFDIFAIAGGIYIIYMVILTFKEGFVNKDKNAIIIGLFFGFLLSCYIFLVSILVIDTPHIITELMPL